MYLVLPTGWISEKGEAAYTGSTERKAGNPTPCHLGLARRGPSRCTGWGRLTWHLVHGREHGALHRGVAAAPAALVVEAKRQVLGGRGGAESKA